MSPFQKLADAVSDERIRIVQEVAVPRSVSTALGRALNEGATWSIFINEPFTRQRSDIQSASDEIWRAIMLHKGNKSDQMTVIIKNISRHLTAESFKQLLTITDRVVWCVRDPLVQLGSLLTRVVNDELSFEGSDDIKPPLSESQIELGCALLESGRLSSDFSRTGWQPIGELFDLAQSYGMPSIAIDGGKLVSKPTEVLTTAANQLGLLYRPSMVGDWQDDYVHLGHVSESIDRLDDAWLATATTSTGIIANQRLKLDYDKLPVSLRNHIDRIAYPTYNRILAETSAV